MQGRLPCNIPMGHTALISFPSKPVWRWNKEEEEKGKEDGSVVLFPIKCMEILGVYALPRRGPLAVSPHYPLLTLHLLTENHLLCMFSKDNKTTGVGFREATRIIRLDGWTNIRLLKVV